MQCDDTNSKLVKIGGKNSRNADKEKHNYAAIGDGGNVIYVNSENKIVVGVAGTYKPMIFDRGDFIEKKTASILKYSVGSSCR